jgi:hypothetical protein
LSFEKKRGRPAKAKSSSKIVVHNSIVKKFFPEYDPMKFLNKYPFEDFYYKVNDGQVKLVKKSHQDTYAHSNNSKGRPSAKDKEISKQNKRGLPS